MPFRLLPIRNNRIFVSNYYGRGFGDNCKYIVDELNKHGNYDIRWLTKDGEKKDFPKNVKSVRHGTLSELFYLSTAHIWIDNSRKPFGVSKRKKQYYIQTWHSSLRLKKIEMDAEKNLNPLYVSAAKNDSKMIDVIISGCNFSTNIYKNSFWYDGIVLECGTPRCDIVLNKKLQSEFRKKICAKYSLDPTKKIVLYAPTFRNDHIYDNRYIDCNTFAKKLGDEYALLLRIHPNMNNIEVGDNVTNVTEYPDMQELLCAVDYLITDYSGCCFDMMIAKKPCILYVPDLKQYLKDERELYFSFDELPFKKTLVLDELADAVKEFNYKEYLNDIQTFGKRIGLCEKGNASETIVDLIIKKCEGKNE